MSFKIITAGVASLAMLYGSNCFAEDATVDLKMSPAEKALIEREAAKIKLSEKADTPGKYSKDNPYAAKLRPELDKKLPEDSTQEAKDRQDSMKSEQKSNRSSRRSRGHKSFKESAGSRFKDTPSRTLFGR